MEPSQGSVAEVASTGRRYRSPNRILARTFRLGRDKWKDKHHVVQAKLEQTRQLAAERGAARDRWREDCAAAVERAEAAEKLAAQRLAELEQVRVQLAAGIPRVAGRVVTLGSDDPEDRGVRPYARPVM